MLAEQLWPSFGIPQSLPHQESIYGNSMQQPNWHMKQMEG